MDILQGGFPDTLVYDQHRIRGISSIFPGFIESMILMKESLSLIEGSELSIDQKEIIVKGSYDIIHGTKFDPLDSVPKVRKVLTFIKESFDKDMCNLLYPIGEMDRIQTLWVSLVSTRSDTFKSSCKVLHKRWYHIMIGSIIPTLKDDIPNVKSFVDRIEQTFDPYATIISNMIEKNLRVHQSRYNVMISSIIMYND